MFFDARRCEGQTLLGKGAAPYVYADPQHKMTETIPLPVRLGQHAGDFASFKQDIIGPLDPGRQPLLLETVGDGQCAQPRPAQRMFDARAKYEAQRDRCARRSLPARPASASAAALVVGYDQRPFGRAVLRQGGGGGVRAVHLVEDIQLLAKSTGRWQGPQLLPHRHGVIPRPSSRSSRWGAGSLYRSAFDLVSDVAAARRASLLQSNARDEAALVAVAHGLHRRTQQ